MLTTGEVGLVNETKSPTAWQDAFLRDVSLYTASIYIAQAAMFVAGLLTKRFLGPTNVGIWSFLTIILGYLPLVQLGVSDAAAREIPYWNGRGEPERAARLRDAMFTFVTAMAVLTGVAVLAVAFLLRPANSPEAQAGLVLLGLIFPVHQLVVCYLVLLRAHKQFGILGRTQVMIAVLNVALAPLLAWRFGLYGLYASFAVQTGANLAYWLWLSRRGCIPAFRWRWHWGDLQHLLQLGISLTVGGAAWGYLQTIDGLVVGRFLGATALGYYAMGLSVNNFLYNAPISIAHVLFPRFQERYGATGSQSSLRGYIEAPIIGLAFIIVPLFIGAGFIGMPLVIRQVLPQFTPGIPAVQVLVLGTFFMSLMHPPIHFVITINEQLRAIPLGVTALLVTAGLDLLAVHLGWGIVGVAGMTAVGYCLAFTLVTVYALSHVASRREVAAFLGKVGLAFAYTMLALYGVDHFLGVSSPGLVVDLALSAAKFGVFGVLLLPLLWYADTKTRALSRAWHLARQRRAT